MSSEQVLNQPFFQITLPLMVTFIATIWVASWSQNKRIEDLRDSINRRMDDMGRWIDEVVKRLDRIEELLQNRDRHITALEERTSPLARR